MKFSGGLGQALSKVLACFWLLVVNLSPLMERGQLISLPCECLEKGMNWETVRAYEEEEVRNLGGIFIF